MKRKGMIVFGAAALGAALALLGGAVERTNSWIGLTAPLRAAGEGLRSLSLSGTAGNLAAWAMVLAVSALPLLLAWTRRHWGQSRGREDWLPALGCPVLFYGLYYLVNPTLLGGAALDALKGGDLDGTMSALFLLGAVGTLLSLAVAWLVLKLLRGMNEAPTDRLTASFRALLVGGAALLAFSSAYVRLADFLTLSRSVIEGNTAARASAVFTNVVLFLLALLELAPDLLAALTLLWGADLAVALGDRTFGQETLDLCGRTAESCRRVAQATVLLAVGANLLQLLMMSSLLNSHFSISLPLFHLLLSAALFLLCRCLQRGKELQDDSDSII